MTYRWVYKYQKTKPIKHALSKTDRQTGNEPNLNETDGLLPALCRRNGRV